MIAFLFVGLLPYFLCLMAIGRYQHFSRFQLVLRTVAFLAVIKIFAVLITCYFYSRSSDAGMLSLYAFSGILFPEFIMVPIAADHPWSSGARLILLGLASGAFWGLAMVYAVAILRHLRGKLPVVVFVLAVGGLARNSAYAANVETLPTKRVKILPTKDVVVMGFVDGNIIALPEGANPLLRAALNEPTGVECLSTLADWAGGVRSLILSDVDRQYANAWLVKYSANTFPPISIDPALEESKGDFRIFNRLQTAYRVKDGQVIGIPKYTKGVAKVGTSPNPCNRLLTPADGEAALPANGAKGITTSQTSIFQVNEGRIGAFGQAVDKTLNDPGGAIGATTPWIWSVIKFDDKGDLVYPFQIGPRNNHQIFPTYNVYVNGQLDTGRSTTQSHPETFISLDETSQVSEVVP